MPQGFIKGKGIALPRGSKLVRKVDLIDVARRDVFLRAEDQSAEILLSHSGRKPRAVGRRQRRSRAQMRAKVTNFIPTLVGV